VIPVSLSFKSFDITFFSFNKVKKVDYLILFLIVSVGICSMFVIPHLDVLKDYYVSDYKLSSNEKYQYLKYQIIWIFSWLIGWEFIHRYLVIKSFNKKKIYHALWILPILEGFYHINKPWPEMLAAFAFSWILTKWTLKRSSVLFPLLAHLIIELELILFQLYFYP
jgi:membrane protease YdiL (CAAX protease family)